MAANLSAQERKPPRLEPQPTSDAPEPQAPAVSRISALAQPAADPSPAEAVPDETTAVSKQEEIARAAYFIAEARGFEPGHELDDWLAAEQQIGST